MDWGIKLVIRDDLGSFKHHPGKLRKLLADVDYSSGGRTKDKEQEVISKEHENVEETHLLKKVRSLLFC